MKILLDDLCSDHVAMRSIFELLVQQLVMAKQNDKPDVPLMGRISDCLAQYPTPFYRPKKLIIFQHYASHCAPNKQTNLAKITEENLKIEQLVHRLRYVLENIFLDIPILVVDVMALAAEYLMLQLQVMDLEEKQLFPEIRRQLTARDWQVIGIKFTKAHKPKKHSSLLSKSFSIALDQPLPRRSISLPAPPVMAFNGP